MLESMRKVRSKNSFDLAYDQNNGFFFKQKSFLKQVGKDISFVKPFNLRLEKSLQNIFWRLFCHSFAVRTGSNQSANLGLDLVTYPGLFVHWRSSNSYTRTLNSFPCICASTSSIWCEAVSALKRKMIKIFYKTRHKRSDCTKSPGFFFNDAMISFADIYRLVWHICGFKLPYTLLEDQVSMLHGKD